jgi:ABC-2 type transport system permease protein
MRAPAWWAVTRWEFMRVLTRKDFYVSLLVSPLLLLGGGALGGLVGRMSDARPDRVAVVRPAGLADTLGSERRIVWSYPAGPAAARDTLRAAMDDKQLDGAVFLPADFAAGAPVELLLRRDSPRLVTAIEGQLRRLARLERAGAFGMDSVALRALEDSVRVRAALVSTTTGASRTERITAFALLVLFFIVQFATLAYMMSGVSAEKSNRITEVVVSAVSPQTWIDGKLVAYTGLGLLQAAVYLVSGLGFVLFTRFELPPIGSPFFVGTAVLLSVLGLFLYSALTAAMMATMKDLQTTQSMNSLFVFLPFLLSGVFMGAAIDQPDAPWMVAVSMIPLVSPMLTPVRMALGGVAPWEVPVTIALLLLAVWWMRGLAGHAYRVAMLMYGKDVSLPELLRWSREK